VNVSASAVANAYASAAKTLADPSKRPSSKLEGAAGGAEDFGAMVKDALDQTTATLKASEQTTLAQATGKADIVDVVTAVAETEVTMRTLVTVRDRVIAAYQEIMRMPI
jgi:flagellar hook-basal body complex protein FliE